MFKKRKNHRIPIMKTGIPSFCLCVRHLSGIMKEYELHHQINGKLAARTNEAPVFTSFRRTGRRRPRYLFSSVFLAKRDAEASNERGQERPFMTLKSAIKDVSNLPRSQGLYSSLPCEGRREILRTSLGCICIVQI